MSKYTVTLNDLDPGQIIKIRGKVAYSHITDYIKGKALQEKIERDRQFSRYPLTEPHYVLHLHDVEFIPNTMTENKAKDDLAKTFIEERTFVTQKAKGGLTGPQYRFQGKGTDKRNLPDVLEFNPETKTMRGIAKGGKLEKELRKGLTVAAELRVFATKMGNNGLSLDRVVSIGPISFYDPSQDDAMMQALEKAGITFVPFPEDDEDEEMPNYDEEIETEEEELVQEPLFPETQDNPYEANAPQDDTKTTGIRWEANDPNSYY